ncbi:MAG: AAA family ATPase, partial [Alphaproteobacteria bacterium]
MRTGAKTDSIEAITAGFEALGYITNPQIATSIYLAQNLEKPLLVEGPPGVGKTELAIATAKYLGLPLVRLQCYEGLDESKALYEWKYGKQLLYTQILRETLGEVLQGARGLSESMNKLH